MGFFGAWPEMSGDGLASDGRHGLKIHLPGVDQSRLVLLGHLQRRSAADRPLYTLVKCGSTWEVPSV